MEKIFYNSKFKILVSIFCVILITVGSLMILSKKQELNTEQETLKIGKYLLQRNDGLDETDYIEVIDNNTLIFGGDYWALGDGETQKQIAESGVDELTVLFTEKMYYKISPFGFVSLHNKEELLSSDISAGFRIADENTLEISRTRTAPDDIADYNHTADGQPKYDEEIIIARYVYSDCSSAISSEVIE